MSDEYIKVTDAINAVYEARRAMPIQGLFADTMSWAVARVQDIPKADVVERSRYEEILTQRDEALSYIRENRKRNHGEWIHDELYTTIGATAGMFRPIKLMACACSECGLHCECESNFCPDCGADMRRKQDETV